MNFLLGAVHGLDYLLTSWVVGGLVFQSWVIDRSERKNSPIPYLKFILLLVLAISVFSFLLTASEIAESWDLSALGLVLIDTFFGRVWLGKFGLLLILTSSTHKQFFTKASYVSLALPLLLALSGHSSAQSSQMAINLPLDWAHFIAVSLWTGGLFRLILWLGNHRKDADRAKIEKAYRIVSRFSHLAVLATAIITASGVILSFRYGVSLMRPWETDYGKLVLLKVALFSLTLSVASINHFVHLRKWSIHKKSRFIESIYRECRIELTIIILIFFAAGFLTRLPIP